MESFEAVVMQRLSVPQRGAALRLVRSDFDPARADEAIAYFRDEVVPGMRESGGLCSIALLLDRGTGKGMAITAWENEAAADNAQSLGERNRATATERFGIRFTGVETYTVIATTVRLD